MNTTQRLIAATTLLAAASAGAATVQLTLVPTNAMPIKRDPATRGER